MERSNEYLNTGIKKGDKRCASLRMSLIEDDSQQGEEIGAKWHGTEIDVMRMHVAHCR